jgi:hypothetical protein
MSANWTQVGRYLVFTVFGQIAIIPYFLYWREILKNGPLRMSATKLEHAVGSNDSRIRILRTSESVILNGQVNLRSASKYKSQKKKSDTLAWRKVGSESEVDNILPSWNRKAPSRNSVPNGSSWGKTSVTRAILECEDVNLFTSFPDGPQSLPRSRSVWFVRSASMSYTSRSVEQFEPLQCNGEESSSFLIISNYILGSRLEWNPYSF